MSFTPLVLQPNLSYYPPTFTCCSKPSFRSREMPQKVLGSNFSKRRVGGIAAMVSILLAQEVIFGQEVAEGFELKMVAPGQAFEEAMSKIRGHAQEVIFGQEVAEGFELKMVAPGQAFEEAMSKIRGHAQALLQIKSLIESESWGEAQKVLRKNSAYLKQDIYTIIQGIPGNERPQLRKLYSNLFNNATRLDYAARDKDASRVWQCYDNIVVALNDILSRI